VETGKQLRRFNGHAGRVNSVAISKNGSRALSGSDDRTVRLWDLEREPDHDEDGTPMHSK
jgi:WD40 repeat protein